MDISKESYEIAEMEIISFENEDIITSSTDIFGMSEDGEE